MDRLFFHYHCIFSILEEDKSDSLVGEKIKIMYKAFKAFGFYNVI